MKLRNKTIRVFLSSTFEDLKAERDALQQGAFKNLRRYCKSQGWQFQAVDLRWGINNEATIDQRTMEICLREIARCQQQSPRPNFIVLLGERYGWRPLPDRVLNSVALAMETAMPSGILSLFTQWYQPDENQLPETVWRLKPREGRYIDYNDYERDVQRPLVGFFTRWAAENLPDPDLAENKTNPLALQRLSMERSATEQEIQAGAFGVEDAHEHVFAFFRNITGCPADNAAFHDHDQNPVQQLRARLEQYLDDDNVAEFTARWDAGKNEPATDHLEKLSADVENCLKKIIDAEIENYRLAGEGDLEQAAHEAFARERTFGFSGREIDIAAICDYTTQNTSAPFVVWGESGTGKSTLLAMAARKVQEIFPHAHVISRFIGVTGNSANGHTLLTDICRNLNLLYGDETDDIPDDPARLRFAFRQYLAKATSEHPLVLFLDAPDQFNDGDAARLLQWLPEVLPPHVAIILSTLKGVSFDVLKERKEPAPVFYEITPLTAEDGRNALSTWLKRANRKLQPHQADQIIRDFEYAGCAPLYLHLAFEQAQHWESYARRQRLGRDIPEMIEDFYGHLSRPEAHGSIVEKVLTAIRCAKQGLSDDEILGVLAADQEFWNNFGIQTYHAFVEEELTVTASRLIPPVLWIRLYHDLEYYLTRRNAPGGEVITFYHRQLAEAVDSIYLQRPGLRQKRQKELAAFFQGKSLLIKETAPIIANVRVCDELPWLLTKSEDWDALTDTLCNLDFIQAKAAAKMTYDLVNDFNAALEVIPDNAENIRKEKERQARMEKYSRDLIACAEGKISRFDLEVPESITPWTEEKINTEIERIKTHPTRADRLRDFQNFLGQEAGNLQNFANDFPHFAVQQAWNYANEGPVGKAAENKPPDMYKSLLRHSPSTRPTWNPLPLAVKILTGHTAQVTSVSITPDWKKALSGSEDNTCILWDLETGQTVKTLVGHTSVVTAVSITPDGNSAASGSADKTCILWNLETGQAVKKLTGHTFVVTAVAITPDGNRAVSGSVDKTCILWDLETGQAVKTLTGHTSVVTAVSITPDGKRALSGSHDKTCTLWDLVTGQAVKTLKGHTDRVTTVSITPDGKWAISGSDDKTYILWDLETGRAIKTLTEHSHIVEAISLTPDGKRTVSGSFFKTCTLWDLVTEQAVKTLRGHTHSVKAVSITPDGKRLISGSSDRTCILWDLEKGQADKTLTEHTDLLKAISITPDGKRAIYCLWDKTCVLWDLENGRPIKTYTITPDDKRVISGLFYKTCILWNLGTGQAVKTLTGHTNVVSAVSNTPSGKKAISGSWDNTCILWDLEIGHVVKTFKEHTDWVNAVSITPDGKRALSGSQDKTCILWDMETGQADKTLKGHTGGVNAISITPDGKRAISGSDDKACILWDLETGQAVKTLTGHTDVVIAVSITPDGKRAISGSNDKACILWDLKTGSQLARLIIKTRITYFALFPKGIIFNSSSGEVIMINQEKELLCPGIPITTARYLWDFELQQYQPLSTDCPLCGHRFAPPASVLEIINTITKKANLRPDQSPCLELPDEAWEEPGLLSECPKCGEVLKFNPFIAGGD
ncbi:MAG: DUF4062 domain-containing protein [Bacteroidales bacterium]|nr:DUF4062 domain-containing protein [Bacteroidales bacterium]